MKPVRLLVDSFADANDFNAQMANARDIVSRLDPAHFHVTMFRCGELDERIAKRPNTRLIWLPPHGQTFRILHQFIWGSHQILFYIKASPAAKLYLAMRRKWFDRRIVIGTIESQSDLYNEPTIKEEQIRMWERTILHSDLLFSNSSAVQASLEKEYSLRSDVIPTGVDTKFFTPDWNRPANPRVRVLFVGSLRPFKGPQLLVRAAAQFPEADFVIAGEGPMSSDLQVQILESHLTNCQLLGGVYGANLRAQYRAADIFLFPSHWEGSPKVILEAAASGLPIIARKDYKPETVIDGQTGYLGGNDDEVLDRLGRLLAKADLRRHMGRASRVLSDRFDWDLITREWEQVFLREASRQGVRS
ncbi:MAG: glycosyltransferase family 4 protein [Candidatus Sulfotelmatobacter sp.]